MFHAMRSVFYQKVYLLPTASFLQFKQNASFSTEGKTQ